MDSKNSVRNARDVIESYFSHFTPLVYKKRDLIFQVSNPSLDIFCVKNGYVRVYRLSEDGEELTLTILKPFDLFPFSWFASDTVFDYYLEALTSLEVWRVPRKGFLEFLKNRPDIFFELITSMSQRLGGLLTRIEYLVRGHAYTKVAATVLACGRRFGARHGSETVVDLPLTHRDIATLVGITRETTCLEMKKLEKKGLIAHKKRLLIIRDMEKLEEESLLTDNNGTLLNNSL